MNAFRFEERGPYLAIATCIIGVLLVGLTQVSDDGFFYRNRDWIAVFGATILGAGFTSAIAFPGYQILLRKTASVVSQGLVLPPDIDVTEISKYDHVWYFYWMSQMDGLPFWRMVKLDLRTGFPGARITTRIHLNNKKKKPEYYRVEAMARRRRLILCFYPEVYETEPPMISIFEILSVDEHHVGTMNLMTWDHTHILSPCIISRSAVCDWKKEQTHADAATAEKLMGFWKNKRVSTPLNLS